MQQCITDSTFRKGGIASFDWLFALSILILITTSVVSDTHGQQKAQPQPTPTPDLVESRGLSKHRHVYYADVPKELTTERFLANKRYDNQEWVYTTINNPETAGVGRIKHDPLPPLFPISESEMIVVGEVIGTVAFLSNDKGSVYTEFAIRVDETLRSKDYSKTRATQVTVDRDGGVVIYPNGQRIVYQDSTFGLPRFGSRYLLFLKKDDESPNYRIVASYDLSREKVHSVEYRPSAKFEDTKPTAFLKMVRNGIAESTRNQ